MLQHQLPHSFPRCNLHFKFQLQSGKQLPRKIKESLICFFLAQREIILLSAKASEHQFLGRIQAKRPREQTSGGRLEMKSAKNPGLRLTVISFRAALHFSDGFSEGHPTNCEPFPGSRWHRSGGSLWGMQTGVEFSPPAMAGRLSEPVSRVPFDI